MGEVAIDSIREVEGGQSMTPSEWTKGKWKQILDHVVGGDYFDGKHHPCPCGQGTDCFRFSDVNGKGNYFCRCSDGSSDGFDLLQCVHGVNFAGAARLVEDVIGPREAERKPRRTRYSERLRSEARRLTSSDYLTRRGLVIPPGLQTHDAVEYRDDEKVVGTFPAILAPVEREGKFATYHATFLQGDQKAPVDHPRKLLPGAGVKGAAVALWPSEPTLGIAEGIETAIAAQMLFGVPTWAALNTSLLKSFTPPDNVTRLVIFGDHDRNHAGQAAAHALAHRLHGRIDVEVLLPDEPGDFNDVLLRGGWE